MSAHRATDALKAPATRKGAFYAHNVEPTRARRLYGARPCAAPCYVAFRARRVVCLLTYSLNTPSIRPCHPSPVLRKYAMTSGLYRTETSSFLFSDLGRPRTEFNGTMAASCFLVSGCASGSDLAAASIFAFECLFPNQLPCERQGQPVTSAVQSDFSGVRVDSHTIL